MIEHGRYWRAFKVGQVVWRLGISPREYRGLVEREAWPTFETYDRIERLEGIGHS